LKLVWSDEFDADGLPDASTWSYDVDRNRLGWYNNERELQRRHAASNPGCGAQKAYCIRRDADCAGRHRVQDLDAGGRDSA
jgi:hypothetical protein